jgi:hypothetical protein
MVAVGRLHCSDPGGAAHRVQACPWLALPGSSPGRALLCCQFMLSVFNPPKPCSPGCPRGPDVTCSKNIQLVAAARTAPASALCRALRHSKRPSVTLPQVGFRV